MRYPTRSGAAVTAALFGMILLGAFSKNAHAAQFDPGTPLDGTNPGGPFIFTTDVAIVGGTPYNTYLFPDADTAEPGDIVILADPDGGDAPSNWLAVARFYSPADPTGSLGLPATMAAGFLSDPSLANPTDFSTFQLFPNVIYEPVVSDLPGGVIVVDTTFTEFGPAGAILLGQTAFFQVIVASPEPASAGLLGVGAMLLLSRRGRKSLSLRPAV